MAKKPTLSPTRVATYLACPVKYRWTFVDARGHWYVRAKPYFSFGLTLHRVLERFHDAGDRGVETKGQALLAYEENWIEAGYDSADAMAEALGEGKQIIERYLDRETEAPRTGRTLFVEKLLKKDMGAFRFIGRVDRIDEHDDGTLEIVDYKSGRESVSEAEVAADLAMCAYQMLLRHAFPDRRVMATIHALRTGDRASASLSDEDLAEFERDLTFIGEEIVRRDFEDVVPVSKRLCAACDFLALCRKHPDFPGAP
ncbi:MAG: PD-(D/E)XK nuclease family protein [Fimbriimonadaceae bacterium]|nr:PD-(D/E)XK nuclease family protein [Fimbriimonadaceae bacterium]